MSTQPEQTEEERLRIISEAVAKTQGDDELNFESLTIEGGEV